MLFGDEGPEDDGTEDRRLEGTWEETGRFPRERGRGEVVVRPRTEGSRGASGGRNGGWCKLQHRAGRVCVLVFVNRLTHFGDLHPPLHFARPWSFSAISLVAPPPVCFPPASPSCVCCFRSIFRCCWVSTSCQHFAWALVGRTALELDSGPLCGTFWWCCCWWP
jgi:hypothetical protein